MTVATEQSSNPLTAASAFPPGDPSPRLAATYRFALAEPADNDDLLRFGRNAEMPGAMRIHLDRAPDYFAALRAEGQRTDVLTCRDAANGTLLAIGHRSLKRCYVDGIVEPVGYLGGLRVAAPSRSARLLAEGYAQLRTLHERHPARIHLTTVLEDNTSALRVLRSGRLGLPSYHDLGRFCCVALNPKHLRPRSTPPGVSVRRAAASDAATVTGFLRREGASRQFFPCYDEHDFGRPGGLLPGLDWGDVFLAFRGTELVGTLAAWDQGAFRRWKIAGYAPWLRALRLPLNLVAMLQGKPTLPRPDAPLAARTLALTCIQGHDRTVFRALLGEIGAAVRGHSTLVIGGLHERDPLAPELLAIPHVPLHSRLFAVAWTGGGAEMPACDRERIPYLETGSL